MRNSVRCREIDIVEGSAEREALHGTVRGLEAWVDGWQNEPKLRTSRQNKARRWIRRKPEERYETDSEALIEGITAWMRGWKDVEEGFRVRERGRQERREERQRRTRLAIDPADNT